MRTSEISPVCLPIQNPPTESTPDDGGCAASLHRGRRVPRSQLTTSPLLSPESKQSPSPSPTASVTKHKHCATNVTRLRKPSKNCLTLLLNMSEPTGEAPGWPAFFLFLFLWAVPLLPIETGTGFVSVSSSDQLVSLADALSEDASS